MADFTPSEQSILDDLVRRQRTRFKRPAWMQTQPRHKPQFDNRTRARGVRIGSP
jgi:hypothetical protein